MSKVRLLGLFTVFVASFILFQPTFAARGDVTQQYQGQTIDDMVINFMIANHIPGLAMAIVQAPYIPRVVSYGLSDIDSKRLASSNTVFNIGQMTTAFTAVAVMQLVEEGKLKLDDPINQYVTNIPKEWHAITLKQLFTHSSGLPSYTNETGFDFSQNYTPEQIFNFIKGKPLLFKPGTNVAASATDYYLLGLAIEKASGMSYVDYVTKNQFERLGLKHSFFISTLNTAKNEIGNASQPFKHENFKHDPAYINPTEYASGYTLKDNQILPIKQNTQSASFANAAIYASAQDISFWDIALAGDILIKDAKNRAFVYEPITLNNGTKVPANAGWQFPGHPGLMYIEGNVPGFTSYLSRFTAELVCVTLLANRDNVLNLEVLGRKIAAAYDEKLGTPVSSAWTITRESPYSVDETIRRFADIVKQQGGKIFAHIDHSKEAASAGQTLLPTQVLIIGNPSKGTDLMNANTSIAFDLPFRALAWQDKAGQVWLSFSNPIELGKAYHVEGQDDLLRRLYDALSIAAKRATSAY